MIGLSVMDACCASARLSECWAGYGTVARLSVGQNLFLLRVKTLHHLGEPNSLEGLPGYRRLGPIIGPGRPGWMFRGLFNPMKRFARKFIRILQVQLLFDARTIRLNSLGAEMQHLGNTTNRKPPANHGKDLNLAVTQRFN